MEVAFTVLDKILSNGYSSGDPVSIVVGMKHDTSYYWVGNAEVMITSDDIVYSSDQVLARVLLLLAPTPLSPGSPKSLPCCGTLIGVHFQVPTFTLANLLSDEGKIYPDSAAVLDMDIVIPPGVDYAPLTV